MRKRHIVHPKHSHCKSPLNYVNKSLIVCSKRQQNGTTKYLVYLLEQAFPGRLLRRWYLVADDKVSSQHFEHAGTYGEGRVWILGCFIFLDQRSAKELKLAPLYYTALVNLTKGAAHNHRYLEHRAAVPPRIRFYQLPPTRRHSLPKTLCCKAFSYFQPEVPLPALLYCLPWCHKPV